MSSKSDAHHFSLQAWRANAGGQTPRRRIQFVCPSSRRRVRLNASDEGNGHADIRKRIIDVVVDRGAKRGTRDKVNGSAVTGLG